jgi:MYXO-CTERM domain-containing protein
MAEPQQQADVSVVAIEADIDVTRQRLAATIDELAFRAQPREIVRREVAAIKASVHDATHTPEGDLRVERVAAVAAAAAALVALVLWRRRRG